MFKISICMNALPLQEEFCSLFSTRPPPVKRALMYSRLEKLGEGKKASSRPGRFLRRVIMSMSREREGQLFKNIIQFKELRLAKSPERMGTNARRQFSE